MKQKTIEKTIDLFTTEIIKKYNKKHNTSVMKPRAFFHPLMKRSICHTFKYAKDNFIDYGIHLYLGNVLYITYTEYEHIKDDPIIGTACLNVVDSLKRLVCHELAHHIDTVHDLCDVPHKVYSVHDCGADIPSGHGGNWQKIYRELVLISENKS